MTVHGVLGEGGMGAAFLASHKVLRAPLVIKTFKTTAPAQLFREAHLAARVVSPHVVAVIDAGVEDGTAFVVQRYVDGIDLDELLHAARAMDRRLPLDLVIRLLLDVSRGLAAIHQAGVVHRDVKPANLFLGGNGVASVGDFGVAVETTKSNDDEPVIGTPLLMAPEQWARGAVDRRTDIYALGGTAHLLATNDAPFVGDGPLQLHVAHATEAYLPPSPRDPREAYFFAVVERMLRKRADDRYPSAGEVARDLAVVTEPAPSLVPHGDDEASVGNVTISIGVGNIAEQSADVIVSAANTGMRMDLGVAAALRRAGGDEIATEAKTLAPVSMGQVAWTGAGRLKAKYVAHAVAALDGAICLQRCALRVLLAAEARGATSIAFPALGTGVGEVPMALGAKLMLESFRTFASLRPRHLREVRVVLYNGEALECWRDVLRSM
ncbi:MAG: serine/threonine-protein kinase [Polyangiales bacterium]